MAHTPGRLGVSTLLASLLWLGLTQGSDAAEESKSQRAKSSSKTSGAETSRVSFRLPRYFASIVDDEQRAALHEIQASYQTKITALELELAELEAAQLKELEGLLTSAQRKTLEAMRAGADKNGAKGDDAKGDGGEKSKSPKSKSTSSGSSKGSSRKPSSSDD